MLGVVAVGSILSSAWRAVCPVVAGESLHVCVIIASVWLLVLGSLLDLDPHIGVLLCNGS